MSIQPESKVQIQLPKILEFKWNPLICKGVSVEEARQKIWILAPSTNQLLPFNLIANQKQGSVFSGKRFLFRCACMIFDGVRFGWIFWILKNFWHHVKGMLRYKGLVWMLIMLGLGCKILVIFTFPLGPRP